MALSLRIGDMVPRAIALAVLAGADDSCVMGSLGGSDVAMMAVQPRNNAVQVIDLLTKYQRTPTRYRAIALGFFDTLHGGEG